MKTHNFHATRAVDVFRGRTGLGATAGVGSILGIPMVGTLGDGQVWVYDAATGTFIPGDPGSPNAELNIEGGQDVIKAHGSMGSTETFDPTDGNVHTGTLDANCTVTLNPPTGTGACSLELWISEDVTGGWTVIWPGSVTEQGTHDTTAGTTQRVIVESVDGGSNWVATWIGGGIAASSFATPAVVLGTAAAAGVATTVIRSDSTIAAFDATVPVTQALGDSAATGSVAKAAHRDHKHGMPALSTATPLVESGSGATGTSTLSSRDDHVHPAAASSSTGGHTHIDNVLFSGTGSQTVWELPVAPIDPYAIAVFVASSRSQDWTLSGALLTTLTFGSAPASGTNNIAVDIDAVLA